MSLYGMMRTGVSGMNAQSNRLGTVADNIANSSTTGYKRAYTEFSSLIIGGEQGNYSPGAVQTTVRHAISDPGMLQFTSSTTDLAVQGNGFFVVQNQAGQTFLTRSGSFVPDSEGRLVNAAGFYLLGTTSAEANLARGDLSVMSISAAGFDPAASTRGSFAPNLPALAEEVPPGSRPSDGLEDAQYTAKTSLTLYTGIGEERMVDIYFTKTGEGTWEVSAFDQATGTALNTPPLELEFDTSTGQLLDPDAANLSFSLPGGQPFTLDLAGVTEFAADYSFQPPVVDGRGPGGVDEIRIDGNGIVSAVNKNGSIVTLFRIPLATVTSPDRLTGLPGNVYQESTDSGTVLYGAANDANRGEIVSNALEGSNVDIAEELTTMIESQRNYTANSKVFQTGADLLDVLVNLKR